MIHINSDTIASSSVIKGLASSLFSLVASQSMSSNSRKGGFIQGYLKNAMDVSCNHKICGAIRPYQPGKQKKTALLQI